MTDWMPLLLSFKLALYSSIILLVIAIPLSAWLASGKAIHKTIIETLVSMPLVLPPTVIGFYLLLAFSPSGIPGKWLSEYLNVKLLFNFEALVIASVIYSLPFMVYPIVNGLRQLPPQLKQAAYILGKSPLQTLYQVLLPNIKNALISGFVLSFAHTIGEFGIVLMIGGNISGETRVASIAIYDEVEMMNYDAAHQYALVLFGICFSILLLSYLLNNAYRKYSKQ